MIGNVILKKVNSMTGGLQSQKLIQKKGLFWKLIMGQALMLKNLCCCCSYWQCGKEKLTDAAVIYDIAAP